MTVSEIYNTLGNILHSSINEEYKEAFLEIQRTTASVDFNGYYIDLKEKKKPVDDLLVKRDTAAAVHELHKITTEGGNNKWNRLLLKLKTSGEFSIDFINDELLEEELAFYKAGGNPQEWLAKKKSNSK